MPNNSGIIILDAIVFLIWRKNEKESHRSFDDSITADDLIDLFLKEIQLTKDETANWFSFDIKPIEFYSTHFFYSVLL